MDRGAGVGVRRFAGAGAGMELTYFGGHVQRLNNIPRPGMVTAMEAWLPAAGLEVAHHKPPLFVLPRSFTLYQSLRVLDLRMVCMACRPASCPRGSTHSATYKTATPTQYCFNLGTNLTP